METDSFLKQGYILPILSSSHRIFLSYKVIFKIVAVFKVMITILMVAAVRAYCLGVFNSSQLGIERLKRLPASHDLTE